MWSGAQFNGMPAGGGWYQTPCPGCGIRLVAYEDVYDEAGNIPEWPAGWEPKLHWQRDD